jgi:hypothetical protein
MLSRNDDIGDRADTQGSTSILMGPVFRAELLRTSRKRHYYVQRVVYGIVLLMVLWLNYERLLVTSRSRGGGKL